MIKPNHFSNIRVKLNIINPEGVTYVLIMDFDQIYED